MDKSTPIGLVAGLVFIFALVFMGDGWGAFFDFKSFLLVIGTTMMALLVQYNFTEVKTIPASLKELFTFKPPELEQHVEEFAEFARVARREGLLALDRRIGETEDDFLRYGLEMAVDGIDEIEIDDLLKLRMANEAKERSLAPKFLSAAALYAPAFGMVGTLIGLIQMMQNLSDPSQIGKGMSLALITTFYGAIFSNLICLPFASKLKSQSAMIMKSREMIRSGILGIVRGESPSMIEKRLSIYTNATSRGKAGTEPAATPLSRAA